MNKCGDCIENGAELCLFDGICRKSPTGRMPVKSEDAVSRSWLLTEYDKRHKGAPGGARKLIEEAPSVHPEPKKGKWIQETKHYKDSEQEFYYYEERCSECGTKRKIGWAEARYCPMCGARMEGMEGEEDD